METKRYAIKCSTEEEGREILDLEKFPIIRTDITEIFYRERCYTIISYAEAVEKGLLGEKIATVCKACLGKKKVSVFTGPTVCSADFIGDKSYVVDKGGIKMVDCSRCNGTGLEKEYSEAPSQKELVEKIMDEIKKRYENTIYGDDLDDYYNGYRAGLITAKNICTKHLSNK